MSGERPQAQDRSELPEGAEPPAEVTPNPASSPPAKDDEAAVVARAANARRGFGCLTLLLVAAIAAAVGGAATWHFAKKAATSAEVGKVQYQCPMHPTIVQDHPGECPICGMKLVPVGTSGAAPKQRKIEFYRSPMNPAQTSPTPRKDEMGMDYVPVYDDEAAASATPVAGLATIDVDPARQQLIGLKTAEVTRGPVGGAWHTFSRVAVDERRVRHVNIKVSVFAETVYASFIGKQVHRGDPLFSGYSPELLAAQAEYRVALSTQRRLAGATEVPIDESDLVQAVRRKLELLDVPEAAIKRIEQGGEATRTITFSSPIEGVVTRKDVVDGMKLDAGAMPYEIVDLSNVWVLADVYESDIHRVKLGMPAKLALKAYPNRTFAGISTFIDPILDPATRTVKLRLEFPNPSGELKPGMFGEATLESPRRDGLRIPVDAVLDSGTRKVVFVALGAGKLEPREVTLGDADESIVEVVRGLSEGEKVVVRANFLVDSESQLRASLAALADQAPSAASAPAPSSAAPTASASAAASGASAPSAAHATKYVCPMDPDVVEAKPGKCPKCGMKLVPADGPARAAKTP